MRHGSIRITALSIALVLGACAAPTTRTPGDAGSIAGSGSPNGSTKTPVAAPGSSADAGARGDTPAPSAPAPGEPYPDLNGVGAMAASYLRAAPATRLIVEVDYVSGRKPSQSTLDHLATILRREADKPGGVSIRLSDELPEQRSSYSLQQIDDLAGRYRSFHSEGDTATMWLGFLNGEMKEQPDTLGVAFRASTAVIFSDQIASASTALVQRSAIERSVTTHEVGHLLALVNLGYTSRFDHEDPDHPGHSSNRGSVMYWAVEDISIASLLTGGPPSDFDRNDRADLADIRTG